MNDVKSFLKNSILLPSGLQSLRKEMRTSRLKIWLRAVLFVQFCGIFGFYLLRDITNEYFNWWWVFISYGVFVPIGFMMSRIVPMQVNQSAKVVTLSLDRKYLVLIWLLVIAKLIASHVLSLVVVSDVIMCTILGLMSGRLGGIGVRVRHLKIQNGFMSK